jgi:hypothetical protein
MGDTFRRVARGARSVWDWPTALPVPLAQQRSAIRRTAESTSSILTVAVIAATTIARSSVVAIVAAGVIAAVGGYYGGAGVAKARASRHLKTNELPVPPQT